MTNQEKYNEAFITSFSISADKLKGLTYQSIPEWDSVGHMTLVSALEDAFDIMLETDDIIDLSSYEMAQEILSSHYGIQF